MVSHRQPAAQRIVLIHAAAPAKPPQGEACNGCGLCCAHAPCPLGILLTRQTRGPCAALQWDEPGQHYRCGVLADPPRWLPALKLVPAAAARSLVARWIGAAQGCDAALVAEPATAQPPRSAKTASEPSE